MVCMYVCGTILWLKVLFFQMVYKLTNLIILHIHFLKNSCDRTEIPKLSDIKQVDTLERISCNITREDFITNYEMTRKPVMLVST